MTSFRRTTSLARSGVYTKASNPDGFDTDSLRLMPDIIFSVDGEERIRLKSYSAPQQRDALFSFLNFSSRFVPPLTQLARKELLAIFFLDSFFGPEPQRLLAC